MNPTTVAGAGATATTTTDGRHLPLLNLSKLLSRMDTVHRFLSDSLTTNTTIEHSHMEIISHEITSSIKEVIINVTALISNLKPQPPNRCFPSSSLNLGAKNGLKDGIDLGFPKTEAVEQESVGDLDIVELDAVELLAEHLHFCEFCGKGFKRDANLRMHKRAHGNEFKTLEALSKPEKSMIESESNGSRRRRFSCPFDGCIRNKHHKKFRPLKSVICVKNHFKRSHCPKMYSCNICHKKNFSVLADLKTHLKHCGETKWKCSCGTSFSRKDKLFGHLTLFEGHMPDMPEAEAEVVEVAEVAAVVVEGEDDGKGKGVVVVPPPPVENAEGVKGMEWADDDDMLFDGLGSIRDDDFRIEDLLGAAGSFDWDL